MSVSRHTATLGSTELTIEYGRYAEQADAAVTVQAGESIVLATVVTSKTERDGIDYFPLMVDYEERLYAAGKISGSRFIKREGRPSEAAILTARLIDRPIRPLFDKSFRRDVQLIVTVLSIDKENDTDVLAIIAASCALSKAGTAPFKAAVGAIRIGLIDGKLVANPTKTQMEQSDLDLVVAGTKERVMMVEAGANEIPEKLMLEALKLAQKEMQGVIEIQSKFTTKYKESDLVVIKEGPTVDEAVKGYAGDAIIEAMASKDRAKRGEILDDWTIKTCLHLEGTFKQSDIKVAFNKLMEKQVRIAILEKNDRPDGRGLEEIRPITVEVSLLPRTHGSGLFTRGQTQSLTIATLGSPGDEQMIDTMDTDGTKRYMHHYNFPPYSTGEASPVRGTSRREVGHGALAERGLLPVIPSKEEFPYTIRLVSEILSSNGSSSMAATCGSTLALMDAGVPIKKPVAGIAMGLVTNDDASDFRVLSDLQGLEDFAGDMDFKIAGTKDGITAIQMDTKIAGLTWPIIEQTLTQAHTGRLFIMDKMLEVLPEPRKEMSLYAPRIITLRISPERIGELIGPGGKNINRIIDMAGGKEITNIDIDDTGLVMISSTDSELAKLAVEEIEDIFREAEIGAIYEGVVEHIITDKMDPRKEIGAIVEIWPGKTGMVHISMVANERIDRISDRIKVGEVVKVKVMAVDVEKGRVSLSIKDVPKD